MAVSENIFLKKKNKTVPVEDKLLPCCWLPLGEEKASSTKALPGHIGDKLWQSDSSGEMAKRITEIIRKAENIVCVSSFLIADQDVVNAMTEACRNRARVYLLTASEIELNKEPAEDTDENDRRKQHIHLLQNLAGRVLVRTSVKFHSKFVLSDPLTNKAEGYLLTCNLTTEALKRNRELGVELSRDNIEDLYRQFLIGFWEESENELLEPNAIAKVRKISDKEWQLPSSILCTTSNCLTLREGVLNLIEQARSELLISTFGIEAGHEVAGRLIEVAKEGKRIRLMVRPRWKKSNMDILVELLKNGAEVRAHPWLHAKAVLSDTGKGLQGLITTANLETQGLDSGFESGLMCRDSDATNLKNALEAWWESFPFRLALDSKASEFEGKLMCWNNEKREDILVQKRFEKDLGVIEAPSFEMMDKTEPKLVLPHSSEKILYHEYVYHWAVSPPHLPKDAKKIGEEGSLSVYGRGNEKFIVIHKPEQLQESAELSNKIKAKVVIP